MKAKGVQAPSSQRGCNSTLRVSGGPGRGWGRPHDHGLGFRVGLPGRLSSRSDRRGRGAGGARSGACVGPGPPEAALPWMWTSRQPFLQYLPPTPFQSCFWGHCLAGIQRSNPGAPGSLPLSRTDGPPTRGQPHSQTPTPHTARGIEPRAGRADAPTMRPSPMIGLAWQLPVLSALSQPRNPLSRARPSPAKGQIRGEKPQAWKEPGAMAASASL